MILEFYGAYSAFIDAALLGVILGVVYDVFRILRIARVPYIMPKGKFYELIKIPERKNKKNKTKLKNIFEISDAAITFIEDVAFWLIAALGEILFIYHINGGAIRIYFIFLTFIGAAIYFFTVGKITAYFSVRIIFLIRCLLYWFFYIIIYPVKLVLILFENAVSFLINITFVPIIISIRKCRAKIYSQKRIIRILTQSRKGFYIYD